jgi:predicted XRE-type DNA-binding protein
MGAQIGVHVFKILTDKKLKQCEMAAVLGIAQPDVSHLMDGAFQSVHDRQAVRLSETA